MLRNWCITFPTAIRANMPVDPKSGFARQLGLFDTTLLVMGGIVGSGIFINPSVVAQQVHTPRLILGVWICGGIVGLGGAFIWAELAAILPDVGGQYAYLREAYHPGVGFLYGWALLLVIQTGGMAAVSITFARYFQELSGLHAPEWMVAAAALGMLAFVNCLGIKSSGRTQSVLMLMRIGAVSALVIGGAAFVSRHAAPTVAEQGWSLPSLGAAMVPVLFAYGGWQTASFVGPEIKDPTQTLPRGLLIGVMGVVALYVAVNWVCLDSLGPQTMAATHTPATAVMRLALGEQGATFIAAAIAISTLGFLSQSILTAPRVYFAMAKDGLFFRAVAWLHPRTRVPVVAIVLQSVWTIVIALSGRYEQILNYVVSMDFLFFGLTGATLFIFRSRIARGTMKAGCGYRVPGHPLTTTLFVLICGWVVCNTIYRYPKNCLIGYGLLLAGVPVYWIWSRRGSHPI